MRKLNEFGQINKTVKLKPRGAEMIIRSRENVPF